MKHFKDFLIKLQTLDIKVSKGRTIKDGQEHEKKYYDISHENPFLSGSFKNELKQLKELAITDILNLPQVQIIFQLQRLHDVKDLFQKFWHSYNHSRFPIGSQHNVNLVMSLNLNDIFICPFLSFVDQAEVNDNFIDDLQDSVRYREEVLQDFNEAVIKVIGISKESETVLTSTRAKIKAVPVFKEGIAEEFINLVKDYFRSSEQSRLINLLKSVNSPGEPLVFNGAGNQLADAFKQLFDANLIVGCNKSELENWIKYNFITAPRPAHPYKQ